MTILATLSERMTKGLTRASITDAARWACEYRFITGGAFPGPFTFNYHPWAYDMHRCEAEWMVGQKAAQMAFTETAIDKSFFTIDVLKRNVLYVLPSMKPDATDFSASRFDPALEESPHLKALFSDTKNTGLKRAGGATLFIRGSRTKSHLKSIPASLIIMDESEEFTKANVPLIYERMSGQVQKQVFELSTPTIPNRGINATYKNSTQNHYIFKCPGCSRHTELTFPDCLVITAENYQDPKILESYLVCKECKCTLPHETKQQWLGRDNAFWQEMTPGSNIVGYHISQLYSIAKHPSLVAQTYLRGVIDPIYEQEFWNSCLGEVHIVEGATVTQQQITDAIGDYRMFDMVASQTHIVTMGVDVGKKLHVTIKRWKIDDVIGDDIHMAAQSQTLKIMTVIDFEDLDELMTRYMVHMCVIDVDPETRKATEFCQRHWGRAYKCRYVPGLSNKRELRKQEEDFIVHVDRTSFLDISLGRYKNKTESIPMDTPQEYKDHIISLTRVYKLDKEGNEIGAYVKEDNKPDHYAHSNNYAEIALPLALELTGNYNIKSPL